jgi:MFS family permease
MRDAPLRIGLIPVALSIPLAWMAFNAPDQASFMPWFILMMLCIAPCNAMSNTLVQSIAPAPLRSRMAAISILTISLLGFTAGPALVGWLSEYVFGEANLGTALKLVISGAMAGTLLFLLLLRPRLLGYLGDS